MPSQNTVCQQKQKRFILLYVVQGQYSVVFQRAPFDIRTRIGRLCIGHVHECVCVCFVLTRHACQSLCSYPVGSIVIYSITQKDIECVWQQMCDNNSNNSCTTTSHNVAHYAQKPSAAIKYHLVATLPSATRHKTRLTHIHVHTTVMANVQLHTLYYVNNFIYMFAY